MKNTVLEAMKTIFAEAPNDEKMKVVASLCASVPYEEFLNHEIVLSQMKKRVCDLIDKIGKTKTGFQEDDIEFLKYLFTHGKYTFDYLSSLHYDYLDDLMIYVRPSQWTHYQIKDNLMYVYTEYTSDSKPLDFNRDIIDARFPVENIVNIWRYF